MDDELVAEIARAAAERLSPEFGSRLAVDVDMALYGRDPGDAGPSRYLDPVALGGLLVSIAQLAWQIYESHRQEGNVPTAPSLAREIRVTQHEITHVDGTQEKIIEVVASEVINQASKAGG